jgi:hypothetical protein
MKAPGSIANARWPCARRCTSPPMASMPIPGRRAGADRRHLDRAGASHAQQRRWRRRASEPVGPATIDVRLIAPDGRELARGQASANPAALATVEAGCDLAVTDPALWSTQAPLLHTLEVDLVRNGQVIDRRRLRLGFRTIRFDAERAFSSMASRSRSGRVHSPGSRRGGRGPARRPGGMARAPLAGYRLQRHPLQPPCPVAGPARRLRSPGHAGDGREPPFQPQRRLCRASALDGAARSQPAQRDHVVGAQRRTDAGQRPGL